MYFKKKKILYFVGITYQRRNIPLSWCLVSPWPPRAEYSALGENNWTGDNKKHWRICSFAPLLHPFHTLKFIFVLYIIVSVYGLCELKGNYPPRSPWFFFPGCGCKGTSEDEGDRDGGLFATPPPCNKGVVSCLRGRLPVSIAATVGKKKKKSPSVTTCIPTGVTASFNWLIYLFTHPGISLGKGQTKLLAAEVLSADQRLI